MGLLPTLEMYRAPPLFAVRPASNPGPIIFPLRINRTVVGGALLFRLLPSVGAPPKSADPAVLDRVLRCDRRDKRFGEPKGSQQP